MLKTAPSLSIYTNITDEDEENKEEDTNLLRSITIGDPIDGTNNLGGDDFSFFESNLGLIKKDGEKLKEIVEKLGIEGVQVQEQPASPPMYLATGFGIRDGNEGFGLIRESKEEYQVLLNEYPNHPVVLKKYADFLESKGDMEEAEHYYFRATQADPSDGEVMSRYATLVWVLHRDREKALTSFEHAIHTASDDSHVLAAYAKFLWEIDADEKGNSEHHDHVQPQDKQGIDDSDLLPLKGTEIEGAGDPNDSASAESYYKKKIQENPSDPMFLKAYAKFLYQCKKDFQGAEEYFSRAIHADPQDGESLSQYAKLVWDLYQDQDKALVYFERAIHAASGDSNVLAAYACFLWAIDDDDVVDKQLESLPQDVLAACAGG